MEFIELTNEVSTINLRISHIESIEIINISEHTHVVRVRSQSGSIFDINFDDMGLASKEYNEIFNLIK